MGAKVTFTTGGTVQAGGGVYLKRSSDEELLQACQEGVFTYVLTSRQMGKSSLMTHAAEQLRSLQIQPLIIDLQSIGIQVTADQWYLGLLAAMEGQLMLDTDILDWWGNHQHLGLTQRFTTFFEQVLLQEISDRLVIFVDEIDTVLSFDFADDFFIAIRYFHQNRAQNPDLYRLSFVLLGVAAPGDLIRNQQRTPFNIGQPIDLRGFSVAEVQPLGAGLAQLLGISEPQALAVLEAVLHWTGGQPFLTQKICQFMTATDSRPAPGEELAWVSALVQEKIIDRWEAQDTPPHLSTIRDRLTRSKEKTARLLGLYQNLLEQGDLPADDRPEQVELRLTGLVVKRDGRLQVFNLIYEAVFNVQWLEAELEALRPYGEALRGWLTSGDEAWLLRGQVLQEALAWAKPKRLADEDYRFLSASQELETSAIQSKFIRTEEELVSAQQNLEQVKQEQKTLLLQTVCRIRRWLGAAGAAALLIVGGTGAWAFYITRLAESARQEAEEAESQARSANLQKYWADAEIAKAQVDVSFASYREAQASQDLERQIEHLETWGKNIADWNNYASLDPLLALIRAGRQWKIVTAIQNLPRLPKPTARLALNKSLSRGFIEINRFQGHEDSVRSVAFSPDGKTIASASDDGTVRLWDLQGNELTIFQGHEGSVRSVAFSPDGKTIASASDDGTVRLWDLQGNELATFQGHEAGVNSVAFSPDGKTIASASGGFGDTDNTVGLWDLQGNELAIFQGHEDRVRSVAFSPDGTMIASASDDNIVRLWDLQGNELTIFQGHEGSVRSVAFSPDGKMIASASDDGTIRLWDLQGNERVIFRGHPGSVRSVAFSPDGKTIASASDDGTVRLWDSQGNERVTFQGHEGSVRSVAFSPDGKTIASASYNRTVGLWDLQGNELAIFRGHSGSARSVAFSPDSKMIASTSDDRTVKLWDFQGNELATFQGHEAGVNSVAFSPDGKMIASASGDWGSTDNTVRLWDLQGNELATFQGHEAGVNSVAFSPDGKTIASASYDRTVRLWPLNRVSYSLDELLTEACDHLRDYLTTNPTVSDSDRALCGIPPKN